MVTVTFNNGNFIFKIRGFHKFWAFKSSIQVPQRNIIKACQEHGEFTFWKGFRMPGTEIPGIITAGTFYKKGWNFWDVRGKENVIVVTLQDHFYKKLIIEVENPHKIMQLLNAK